MSQPSARVLRFNRTERMVHWTQALTFLILLATGLMISFSSLESLVGHRALLREIHLATAFFFVFGPALVTLAGNFGSVRQDAQEVDEWSEDDLHWLAHPTTRPEAYAGPPGRYNAGQKLNTIFTVYSTVAFAVTGLILWQNRRFPFQLVSQANAIHAGLAYVALIVFMGHLFLSTVLPSTRQSFWGMVSGRVDKSWAAHHHPAWLPPSSGEPDPRPPALIRSGILLFLGLEASLLIVRFGFEWLGANVTDPVTKMIYRFSGLPTTLQHPATGSHELDLAAIIWFGLLAAMFLAVKSGDALLPSTVHTSFES